MATANITLPDELLPRLQELARTENRTADELAAQAVQELLMRRFWERNKVEAQKRRGNMTDEQVQEYVDRVIHEVRAENRER
jgi:predicted transcriptional regulator